MGENLVLFLIGLGLFATSNSKGEVAHRVPFMVFDDLSRAFDKLTRKGRLG